MFSKTAELATIESGGRLFPALRIPTVLRGFVQ